MDVSVIHKFYARLVWRLFVRRQVQAVRDELFIQQLREMNRNMPKREADQ
jgi:hypothetical protein